MEVGKYIPPDDAEIAAAQVRMNRRFHPDYIAFIKSGYDLGGSILEPLMIDPLSPHLDLFTECEVAWRDIEVPRSLFPICESNGDYFCLTESGEVRYWSHDGISDERWVTIAEWAKQMDAESR